MPSTSSFLASDAGARRLRETLTRDMRAVFERAGFDFIEPPLLQPAGIFLDRSGEDIRRRLYVFSDPGGAELCLRPDLTIPACRLFLERMGGAGEARLCYSGAVFRFEPKGSERPPEFVQTGAEFFGGEDREEADAEMLALAVSALRAGGLADFEIEMGDLALFDALVDALDIPGGWRSRLKRHFWRPDYFRELVARLAGNGGESGGANERAGLLAALSAFDGQSARGIIADILDLAKISPVGGRSIDEIAERFLERAADANAAPLSKETAALIEAFLALSLAPRDAARTIRDLTHGAGISIDRELDALERRFEALERRGVDLSRARFETGFGRTLEYYTGFVFELRASGMTGEAGAIAGGGRYDGLLQSLGAPSRVPAVGCAITLERLTAALASRETRR